VSAVSVDVRGVRELMQSLDKLDHANANRVLQKAVGKGATSLKADVQREAPKRTGRLRKSATAHRAKRDRPASIVTNRRSRAYWWPMVIGGSKPHDIRMPGGGTIRHPGHKGNDFLSRGLAKGQDKAMAAVAKVLGDYLDSI
jgi:hypothetical protein